MIRVLCRRVELVFLEKAHRDVEGPRFLADQKRELRYAVLSC